MPRRLSRRSVLAGLVTAAASMAEAAAQSSGWMLVTVTEGGDLAVNGDAFVYAVKLANPKVVVRPVPTRGSVENIPLLEAGTIDIGLVFGEMVQELFNAKDGPPTKLKVITTAYS